MNVDRRGFLSALAVSFPCASSIQFGICVSMRWARASSRLLGDIVHSIETLIRESARPTSPLVFHDLASGNELLIHADVNFHPASTIKIAIMMEVFRQAEQKAFSLDDRTAVKNDFVSIVDGSHFSLQAADDSETGLYRRIGEQLTIRELVRLMITESSNVATNMLVERITPGRATEFMRRLGTNDVQVLRGVEDNKAYARGLNNAATARGLMLIWFGSLNGPWYRRRLPTRCWRFFEVRSSTKAFPPASRPAHRSHTRPGHLRRFITTSESSSRRVENRSYWLSSHAESRRSRERTSWLRRSHAATSAPRG